MPRGPSAYKEKKLYQYKPSYKTVRLKFGEHARGSIVRGIERLADTVVITLGPGVSIKC